MAESKSNKSYWVLVVVIVLVIGTVVAKQATKRVPPHSASVVAPPAAVSQPVTQATPAAAKPAGHTASPLTKPAAKPTPPPAPATAPPASAVEQPAEEIELISGEKLEECLKSGRPTIADFGAGWCKPCKLMDPVLKEAAKKYEGKLNVVFVDIDDYPNIAKDYRIGPIPTQVFLNGKGKEVGRHIGYYPLVEFEAQMKQFGVIE
jgi:thioredoxin 1